MGRLIFLCKRKNYSNFDLGEKHKEYMPLNMMHFVCYKRVLFLMGRGREL